MIALLSMLFACDNAEAPEIRFVSPASGQTGVPADLPLRVVAGAPLLPETWELDEPVRVVDLVNEQPVTGRAMLDDQALTFTPDAPWPIGDFAWSVDLESGAPRGPEVDGRFENLQGEDSFSTDARLDVLATPLTRPKTLCLVLSRPATVTEVAAISITMVDGCCTAAGGALPVSLARLPVEEWGDPLQADPGDDPGLDVWCHAFEAGELEPGATIEIDVDGRTFTSVADAYNVPDTLARLRRATCVPRSACAP
jgi:hypothetical protein